MTDYRAVAMAWITEPDHRPAVETIARHLHANESLHLHDVTEGPEPCSYCWLRAAKTVQAIERSGQVIVKELTPEHLKEIEAADLHSLQGDAQHNPDVWTLNEWRKQLLAEVKRLTADLQALTDEHAATCENFADYVEDHAGTYPPTTWSNAVAPGGQVCAVPIPGKPDDICGMPVESEPCPEHTCRCLTTCSPQQPGGTQ